MLLLNRLVGFGGRRRGASYYAPAVVFDGTNDYLTRGGDFTSNADSKVGIYSFWIKPNSLAVLGYYHHNSLGYIQNALQTDGKIRAESNSSGGGIVLDMRTVNALVVGTWYHVLMAWDLAASVAQLYINGVSDRAASPLTITNTAIDWTRAEHAIGAVTTGASNKLNCDLADYYFNNAATLDISVAANREKFRSPAGKPVDLGATGALPTGAQPIVFLSGNSSTFASNKGYGGGMTVNGALTNAATSPSD